MKRNRFVSAPGKALTAAILTILGTVILVPGLGANTYKTIYKFTGGADGGFVYAGLVLDTAGNLYGTTFYGGGYGLGTVFELSPNGDGSWAQRVLHSFNGGDGADPAASLIFDKAGNLYGTTYNGGPNGWGSVFKLEPNGDGSWTESVLYSFLYNGEDGNTPYANLLFDQAGNLYGTTQYGGTFGGGVVFQLRPNGDGSWKEKVLHSFTGTDGQMPFGGLIQDASGNLYGTTSRGGAAGYGTVFELTSTGNGDWTESVLCSFDYASFGTEGGLILDAQGNLYGTTYNTVFKLTPTEGGVWTESVLHTFSGADGASARAGLALDAAGRLYGTTFYGGVSDRGTVFKLTLTRKGTWKEIWHSFQNQPGTYPTSGVIFDTHGVLYGTTRGNDFDMPMGSVYEIKP